jgi:hypothetical protein
MRPESFARWSPETPRKHADFTVRLGTEGDVEACVPLVVAIGAGEEAAWRQTLTRTVRDGDVHCSWPRPAARSSVMAAWPAQRLIRRYRDQRRLAGTCWDSLSIRPGGGGGSARH